MDPNTYASVQSALNVASVLAEPPKALAVAVAAYEAATGSPVDDVVDINAEALTVTADKVGDLLDRAVAAEMRRQVIGPVRGEVLDRLGRRVVREVRAAGPAIIDAMADPFNDAAAMFTEAHGNLPPGRCRRPPGRCRRRGRGRLRAGPHRHADPRRPPHPP